VTNETTSEPSATEEDVYAIVNPNAATTQYWVVYGTSATKLTSTSNPATMEVGPYIPQVSVDLPGLTANTTYYYQVVASNSVGTTKGAVQNFTTNFYAPTPVISPGSENFTSPFKVTITQSNPAATIYYTTDGNNPSYDSSAIKYTGPFTVSATAVITAQTEAVNAQNNYTWSNSVTATYTRPTAPTVENEDSSVNSYSPSSAQLTAQINAGGETTQYWFVYGTSATALTSTTGTLGSLSGITNNPVYANLSGLAANTTYYYQGVASNSIGTAKGTVQSFTTQ
jgi:hypothetical protein